MLLRRAKVCFITFHLMIEDLQGDVAASMANNCIEAAFRSLSEVSNSHDVQFGKSGAIEALIKRQQAVPFFQSVSADEKVGQNAAWLTRSLLAAATCVLLKRLSGSSPDQFIHGPVDRNSGVLHKLIQETFRTPRERQQLRKDCAANYEFATRKCRIESCLRGGIEGVVSVPECNEDISIDSADHLLDA